MRTNKDNPTMRQGMPVLSAPQQLADPPHFCVCIGHAWKMLGSNLYAIADPADGQLHTAGHVSDNRLIFGGYDTCVDNLIAVTGVRALSANRVRVLLPVPAHG